jgi:hypothetical protein
MALIKATNPMFLKTMHSLLLLSRTLRLRKLWLHNPLTTNSTISLIWSLLLAPLQQQVQWIQRHYCLPMRVWTQFWLQNLHGMSA